MKKYRSGKIILKIFAVVCIINILSSSINIFEETKTINKITMDFEPNSALKVVDMHDEDPNAIVYDNLTKDQLAEKLEKNLNSTLKGYGKVFAEYSLKYEVDPYVATSIVLLETGCKWNCSTLVKKCNNIGGMKGKSKCSNSSYARFDTLDEGIEAFFKNLSNNYYQKGLTTPAQMNRKYAENPNWYKKVNKYVDEIKSS